MDLIDRQAAIDTIEKYSCNTQRMIDAVKVLPPVDATPVVHGVWITQGTIDRDGNQNYHCSVCKCGELHSPKVVVKYCWNCGARMEESDE